MLKFVRGCAPSYSVITIRPPPINRCLTSTRVLLAEPQDNYYSLSWCVHGNDAGGSRCGDQTLDPIGHLGSYTGTPSPSRVQRLVRRLAPLATTSLCRTQGENILRGTDGRSRSALLPPLHQGVNELFGFELRWKALSFGTNIGIVRAFSWMTSLGAHLRNMLLGMVPQTRQVVAQAEALRVSGKMQNDTYTPHSVSVYAHSNLRHTSTPFHFLNRLDCLRLWLHLLSTRRKFEKAPTRTRANLKYILLYPSRTEKFQITPCRSWPKRLLVMPPNT